MKIHTTDAAGNPNGFVLPLWNATERPELRPEQVYLTAIAQGAAKGPHLHKRREQRYYCIKGQVDVVSRSPEGVYTRTRLAPGLPVLVVPAGTPSMLRNAGAGEAWVINMPAPAWTADDQDEWPVADWDHGLIEPESGRY